MDYKIVLDAGHGGDDSGAVGNGIIEKNLTLDITKYLYDRFNELGIPVKVTRLTDETISPTDRVNRVLNAFGNSKDVIVISNHINAGGGEGSCDKLTFFEKLRKIFHKNKIKYLFCVILDISSDRLCLR